MKKRDGKQFIRRLFQELNDDSGFFEFVSITGFTVVFRWGGCLITFEEREGRLMRRKDDCPPLNAKTYVFLFKLAEGLMQAVRQGYIDGHERRKNLSVTKQLELVHGQTAHDPADRQEQFPFIEED